MKYLPGSTGTRWGVGQPIGVPMIGAFHFLGVDPVPGDLHRIVLESNVGRTVPGTGSIIDPNCTALHVEGGSTDDSDTVDSMNVAIVEAEGVTCYVLNLGVQNRQSRRDVRIYGDWCAALAVEVGGLNGVIKISVVAYVDERSEAIATLYRAINKNVAQTFQ